MSIRCLMLCAGTLLPAGMALAQFTPAWTWNRHDWFVTTTGAITTTRGYEFTVSAPITVTGVGVFDVETAAMTGGTARAFPGLAQAHPVALWNLSNTTTPLASATVAAGQGTPLCQDGYRYAPITPTTLNPGSTYVVSAFWPGDDGSGDFDPYPDIQSSAAPVTYDPRITIGQSRYALFSTPSSFPSNGGGAGNFYIGLLDFRIAAGSCEDNPAPDLATTFQGGNGQAGNMFDLTALNAQGITVNSWQINLNDDVTNRTPVAVSIYTRQGSFVGHESSPDGWALLGTVNVLSWGGNQGTPLPLGGVLVPGGSTVGVFITTNFITSMPPPASPPFLNYSNIPPAGSTFSNADLRITAGVGKANPRFTGATFFSKMWNGGVVYTIGQGSTCYANCDGSTAAPILNVNDFVCFQTAFAAGCP